MNADRGESSVDSSIADLPDAMSARDAIARLVAGRRIAVFCDYDGTLTPIIDDPDAALIDGETRALLARLGRVATTAIVSGRDVADVRAKVAVRELTYVGSHGFEITDGDGTLIDDRHGRGYLGALDAAEAQLRSTLAGTGGRLERKRFAVTVHYRGLADARVPAVEAAVDAVAGRHADLRKTSGKKVFELRPNVDWDKGKAVLALIERLGLIDAAPVYLGDDVTDEDAFTAIADRGLGIVVRGEDDARLTAARFSLPGTAAVGTFLAELADLVARRAGADPGEHPRS